MWRWSGNILTDQRATHFWDEQKIVGHWYAAHGSAEEKEAGIIWDAYYLYGPEAEWTGKPEPLLGSGGTVREKYAELEQKLAPILGK